MQILRDLTLLEFKAVLYQAVQAGVYIPLPGHPS